MIRRTLAALAIGATAALALAAPAAATDDRIPVKSDCNIGLFVNADEEQLLPEQTPAGILLDGPSIAHLAIEPTKLSDLPKHALLDVEVIEGVPPLVKFETHNPYSTVNIDASGKFWSSKIAASEPGGQSNPVAEPGDLVGLWNYTESTVVFTVGFGYANDEGNKALVKSLTFAGKTYDFSCQPPTTESPSPSAGASSPAGGAGETPAATPSASGAAAGLPVTGSSTTTAVGIAGALLVAGLVLFFVFRRRRVRFTA